MKDVLKSCILVDIKNLARFSSLFCVGVYRRKDFFCSLFQRSQPIVGGVGDRVTHIMPAETKRKSLGAGFDFSESHAW